MEKILQCPIIMDNDIPIGYGGNQEWFVNRWAQKAGCASVSAHDIYSYYIDAKKIHQKKEYLKTMEEMFVVMTPKKRGFPYAYLYAKRLHVCLKEKDITVSYQVFRNPEPEQTVQLVKQTIDKGNPLGLLILKHYRWQLRHDIWHWVTIFGYRETKKGIMIIFSDCGEKKEILARILFEKHKFNYFKLVVFDKQ